MDEKETANIINERLTLLPEEILELIQYKTVDVIIEEVTVQYSLNRIQSKLLENEALLVLLCLLPTGGFKDRIQQSLEIDPTQAESISNYVQTELFYLASDSLKSANDYLKESEADSALPTKLPSTILDTKTINDGLDGVIPLRTMDMDAKKIHGYGAFYGEATSEEGADITHKSSQDSVLPSKKPPSYSQPSTDTPE